MSSLSSIGGETIEAIVVEQDSLETVVLVAQFEDFAHGESRFFDHFFGGLVWRIYHHYHRTLCSSILVYFIGLSGKFSKWIVKELQAQSQILHLPAICRQTGQKISVSKEL
jgi:hypothetical protein